MQADPRSPSKTMKTPSGSTLILGAAMVGAVGIFVFLGVFYRDGHTAPPGRRHTLETIPFDGAASMQVLRRICDLGPRISGSQAMETQQRMLKQHFEALGGKVEMQEFVVRHPETGEDVVMRNMIVRWHPERKRRVLLCCHYDTRPQADRDPVNPLGAFLGANDGASGVGLLAEMGRHMPDFDSALGVDFVLFDGEEFVFNDPRDTYFLGSEHFARRYANEPRDYEYVAGVLFDMVGDAELQLFYEKNSVQQRNTRAITKGIWDTARKLGVREFIPRVRHEVRDDHLPLNNIAKIPTCDIIDFDYPRPGRVNFWHTQQDTPDKCSPLSLAKVGWVALEWLKTLN